MEYCSNFLWYKQEAISGLTEDVEKFQSEAFSFEQKYKAECADRDIAEKSLAVCQVCVCACACACACECAIVILYVVLQLAV